MCNWEKHVGVLYGTGDPAPGSGESKRFMSSGFLVHQFRSIHVKQETDRTGCAMRANWMRDASPTKVAWLPSLGTPRKPGHDEGRRVVAKLTLPPIPPFYR